MTVRSQAIAKSPTFPWLEIGATSPLRDVLLRAGVMDTVETIRSVDRAGEGNMNLTLRVTLASDTVAQRTLIVKQSRPWVEKYDVIAAPWDRALVEAAFYERITAVPSVRGRMPKLAGVDAASRTIVLQDLGAGHDLSSIYRSGEVDAGNLQTLAHYLRDLHEIAPNASENILRNRDMRHLNHAHVFDLPLATPKPDELNRLEPGLGAVAARLAGDADYTTRVRQLGKRYLDDGPNLLHGDFFPGSWLATSGGLHVIDPEFCFFGDAALDVGVAIAHLALARQKLGDASGFLNAYGHPLNPASVSAYAAVEVMRRLIGVAQLPLSNDRFRGDLLARSGDALRAENWELLWT